MKKKISWLFANLEFVLSAICMASMALLCFIQVVSRVVLSHSLTFTEELCNILFILSIYIGAIGGTRRNQHLRLELVTNMLSAKGQAICKIVANICFVIINGFLFYGLLGIIKNLFAYNMLTPILKIAKWIPYTVIPLALVLMSVRLIQEVIKICKGLQAGEYDKKNSAETGGV